jgi:hypothetical protein
VKRVIGIGVILILLWGCSSKDSKEGLDNINPGLYEIQYVLKTGEKETELIMRVRYDPDGIYYGKNYLNNVPIEEFKGMYKVEEGKLKSYDKYVRVPDKDGYGWSSWTSKEPSSVAIRNIEKMSYQYYIEFPNEQEKKQYASLGIYEGWKTYKRIAD